LFRKIIRDTSNPDQNFFEKISNLYNLTKFYRNFGRGLSSGKIFHEISEQNTNLIETANHLKKESDLLEKIFTKDVKNFLKTKKLNQYLDFDNRNSSDQIGLNTIYVDKPISGLWTTGMATFYIPTKPKYNNKILINFRSITPLTVIIKFEKNDVKTIQIPKLSTKTVEITILPEKISDTVSEISISTDRLWLPNVILQTKKSLALGIGIQSIKVSYF